VATGPTPKNFALAVVRMGVSTGVTALRGVSGMDEHELATAPFELVGELLLEQRPALIEDRAAQARLLAHPLAGRCLRGCDRRAHRSNPQSLQAHERGFAGDLRRELVKEIRPLAGDGPLVAAQALEARTTFCSTCTGTSAR